MDGTDHPAHYPDQWEADVALADGGIIHIRPIIPEDGPRIERFHSRQSPESIYFRFFSPRPKLTQRDLDRFTHVDYVDRLAIVGLMDDEIIGVARYDRHAARSDAEVAFFTDDEHHGRGLATLMLEYLAAAAREVGISGFTASVLPANRKMLSVFKQAGFDASSRFTDGLIEVELAIEPTEAALAAMEARARQAGARSIERILSPHSIAVVGASRTPGTIGHEVFRNLVERGFEGPVYPVNTEASSVASVRTYASVLDIPDRIDLAVLAIPAEQIPDVVEQCAHKGAKGLIVLSAGFAEDGPEGAALERTVVEAARRRGMRVIGPNTMGVINTDPAVSMHATFSGVEPLAGSIGFSSQSGTIGAAILERATALGLGISSFVAVGNRADVSGNDLLQYWAEDDRTDVVLLYLESFGNPRNFSRIARELSRQKPIVAVSSGRSVPVDGRERAPDDGSAWPAHATLDAMLAQAGVIRVDTLDQVFDVCRILVSQPLPPGPRVALLTNAWGPAVLAGDACVASHLQLATISELGLDAGPDAFRIATEALLQDPGVDAVFVIYAPPLQGDPDGVAEAITLAASAHGGKPVVATMLRSTPPPGCSGVPEFAFPEAAAQALGRVHSYAAWRTLPSGDVPEITGLERAQALVAAWLGEAPEGRSLNAEEIGALLASVGIDPLSPWLVHDDDGAIAAASKIGYPVALKATGLARLAQTEAGGVALDIHDDAELRRAYGRMRELLGPAMEPALVQAMADPGPLCCVGIHQHPSLGALITLGPGSVTAATVDQVVMRVLPLTDADAEAMVEESTVAFAIDDAGPEARARLVDLLLRTAALADAVPELAMARLDPVLVSPAAAAVTDARVRLAPCHDSVDPAVRRLR